MDSLKDNMCELKELFESRMAEFQRNLQSSTIPATSPTSNIASQFGSFRSFVLGALEALQLQLGVLARKHDEFEMRSRRKILLIHGIKENVSNVNVATTVVKTLSEHLKIPDIKLESISRCQRLGRTSSNKPRAILVKFRDLALRNKVWFAKTGLKNSGITLSEFLTKERHETFLAARQRLGVSRCWTKSGYVVVVGVDGTHNYITTMAELNSLAPASSENPQLYTIAATGSSNVCPKDSKNANANVRAKRVVKK